MLLSVLGFLFYQPQPLAENEIDPADQQGHTGHNRIAEGGAKGDHQKPDTDFSPSPHGAFVLLGEEKVNQRGKNPEGQKDIIQRGKPVTGP